jgi:hypothetical protein
LSTLIGSIDPKDPLALIRFAYFFDQPLAQSIDLSTQDEEWRLCLAAAVVPHRPLHSIFLNADFLASLPAFQKQYFAQPASEEYEGILWPEQLGELGTSLTESLVIANMEKHMHADLISKCNLGIKSYNVSPMTWKIIPPGYRCKGFDRHLELLLHLSSDFERALVLLRIWHRFVLRVSTPYPMGIDKFDELHKMVEHSISETLLKLAKSAKLAQTELVPTLMEQINALTVDQPRREAAMWHLDTVYVLNSFCPSKIIQELMAEIVNKFRARDIPAVSLRRLIEKAKYPGFSSYPNFNQARWEEYFTHLQRYYRTEPFMQEPFTVRLLKWQIYRASAMDDGICSVGMTELNLEQITQLFLRCDPFLTPISLQNNPVYVTDGKSRVAASNMLEVADIYLRLLGKSVSGRTHKKMRPIGYEHRGYIRTIIRATLYKFTRTGRWDLAGSVALNLLWAIDSWERRPAIGALRSVYKTFYNRDLEIEHVISEIVSAVKEYKSCNIQDYFRLDEIIS